MNETVTRRALLGALGAGALLPSVAGAQNFFAGEVPAGSQELWTWVRAQLVLEPGLAWLDTAGAAPALRAVMVREYRSRERQSLDFREYERTVLAAEPLGQHLQRVAAALGAQADEVAVTTGSLEGIGIVARGLDLARDDEVLCSSRERAAAVGPWRVEAARRGIKLVEVQAGGADATPEAILGAYAGAITPRTRALMVSHVQSTDGTAMPVREICTLARANGVYSLVDGAQGPGHVPVDVAALGCDAYATAFHRWLNASRGVGALYVRRDAQPRVWPLAQEAAFPTGAQARYGAAARLLGPAVEGVAIALEFQRAVNPARSGARIRELAAYLRMRLATVPGLQVVSPSHASLLSGIVAVRLPGRDHAAIGAALAAQDRIVVGHVSQPPAVDAIRVSLHPGTDLGHLDRCVDALRRHA